MTSTGTPRSISRPVCSHTVGVNGDGPQAAPGQHLVLAVTLVGLDLRDSPGTLQVLLRSGHAAQERESPIYFLKALSSGGR